MKQNSHGLTYSRATLCSPGGLLSQGYSRKVLLVVNSKPHVDEKQQTTISVLWQPDRMCQRAASRLGLRQCLPSIITKELGFPKAISSTFFSVTYNCIHFQQTEAKSNPLQLRVVLVICTYGQLAMKHGRYSRASIQWCCDCQSRCYQTNQFQNVSLCSSVSSLSWTLLRSRPVMIPCGSSAL